MGINTTNVSLNSTYIQSTDSFDEILKSHCKCIESVAFEMYEEDTNLPNLYWTPKLNKVPVTLKLASMESNSMWIVKNSTSLLPSLDQLDIPTATSIQTYYFSILYTSLTTPSIHYNFPNGLYFTTNLSPIFFHNFVTAQTMKICASKAYAAIKTSTFF